MGRLFRGLLRLGEASKRWLLRLLNLLFEMSMLPLVLFFVFISRIKSKPIDVGLGPEPMINNVFHKRALQLFGFTAETFVSHVFFITEKFDIRADKKLHGLLRRLRPFYLFFRAMLKYRVLLIYFNGGPLCFTRFYRRLEPYLYRWAGVKTLVLAYGGDVHNLLHAPNLSYRHAAMRDYAGYFKQYKNRVQTQIDRWVLHGDHIISGCDWVYYVHYYDTLMLAHFSIDTEEWAPQPRKSAKSLKILHAPNHRHIKGTRFFVNAVETLKKQGYAVELTIIENVPNEKIKELVAEHDVIADQLIIGWYAMFALEAMSMQKPVLCFIEPELELLYTRAGLLQKGELPIVKCSPETVTAEIKKLCKSRRLVSSIGRKSRQFVKAHHSLEAVGHTFKHALKQMRVEPAE